LSPACNHQRETAKVTTIYDQSLDDHTTTMLHSNHIKQPRVKMRQNVGYALISKTEMAVTGAQLPIYWLKKVALEEAVKFDKKVVKVRVEIIEGE